MDRKYLENLINKFEQSLSETERMSNSLIELTDVLSKLDISISKVDKSIETIYEDSEIELLTEKSIDAVSSLQLVKKQSMDILKNIKSFKDLQNDLCKVQKEVNEEYNSLIELNKEKLIISHEIENFKAYISDINIEINKLHEDNLSLNKEIASLKRSMNKNYKTLKEEIIDAIKDSSSNNSNSPAQQLSFENLQEDISENKDKKEETNIKKRIKSNRP